MYQMTVIYFQEALMDPLRSANHCFTRRVQLHMPFATLPELQVYINSLLTQYLLPQQGNVYELPLLYQT